MPQTYPPFPAKEFAENIIYHGSQLCDHWIDENKVGQEFIPQKKGRLLSLLESLTPLVKIEKHLDTFNAFSKGVTHKNGNISAFFSALSSEIHPLSVKIFAECRKIIHRAKILVYGLGLLFSIAFLYQARALYLKIIKESSTPRKISSFRKMYLYDARITVQFIKKWCCILTIYMPFLWGLKKLEQKEKRFEEACKKLEDYKNGFEESRRLQNLQKDFDRIDRRFKLLIKECDTFFNRKDET